MWEKDLKQGTALSKAASINQLSACSGLLFVSAVCLLKLKICLSGGLQLATSSRRLMLRVQWNLRSVYSTLLLTSFPAIRSGGFLQQSLCVYLKLCKSAHWVGPGICQEVVQQIVSCGQRA